MSRESFVDGYYRRGVRGKKSLGMMGTGRVLTEHICKEGEGGVWESNRLKGEGKQIESTRGKRTWKDPVGGVGEKEVGKNRNTHKLRLKREKSHFTGEFRENYSVQPNAKRKC